MSSFKSSQLFIGHLHPDTKHRDLEDRFGKYGKMNRCEIKRGYGFIEYEDIRDAERSSDKHHYSSHHRESRYHNDRHRGRDDYDRDKRRRRSSPDYKSKTRDRRRSPSSVSHSRSRSRSRSLKKRI
ncbi:hypothetical protein HZS_1816 [Henneguya salminicola]|nr:hypothetical protein HZS_1816 [Henneguya salminicola]